MKTIIMFFLFVSIGLCQVTGNEAELIQYGDFNKILVDQTANDAANKTELQQAGFQNEAFITQVQNPGGLDPNTINAWQIGQQNDMMLKQFGSGNRSYAVQYGDNNSIESEISGNKNLTVYGQIGDANTINTNVTGNNLGYLLVQYGNGNSMMQIEDGSRSPEYQVTQRGDGMKLIITNGNFPR